MVNQVQAQTPARRDVLKTIGRLNDVNASVYANVLTPGTVGIRRQSRHPGWAVGLIELQQR